MRRRTHGANRIGRAGRGARADASQGSLLGKRYGDPDETVEVLCTKAGPGSLALDGVPLAVRVTKPLPASD